MELPEFQNKALLRQALTHSSYANEHPTAGPDYERLEFLGDSVLELVVRDLLFAHYPTLREGALSNLADVLVDESHLAQLAVNLGIPPRIRLGAGAQRERSNPTVQADVFEAVMGAYHLDAGVTVAHAYVTSIFERLVEQVLERPLNNVEGSPINRFQEYVQANFGSQLPKYVYQKIQDAAGASAYSAEVLVGDTVYGVGQGRSKKEARMNTAIDALRRLKR